MESLEALLNRETILKDMLPCHLVLMQDTVGLDMQVEFQEQKPMEETDSSK
jgi:hypothetical protein